MRHSSSEVTVGLSVIASRVLEIVISIEMYSSFHIYCLIYIPTLGELGILAPRPSWRLDHFHHASAASH